MNPYVAVTHGLGPFRQFAMLKFGKFDPAENGRDHAERLQLSAENAYSVSVPTPARVAASTIFRAVRTPTRWPAVRGRPRDDAHRPLPSMMIPT